MRKRAAIGAQSWFSSWPITAISDVADIIKPIYLLICCSRYLSHRASAASPRRRGRNPQWAQASPAMRTEPHCLELGISRPTYYRRLRANLGPVDDWLPPSWQRHGDNINTTTSVLKPRYGRPGCRRQKLRRSLIRSSRSQSGNAGVSPSSWSAAPGCSTTPAACPSPRSAPCSC
jgi:hypothetical protein